MIRNGTLSELPKEFGSHNGEVLYMIDREAAHFKKWKSESAEMLAEPYTYIKYHNIFPEERGWKSK